MIKSDNTLLAYQQKYGFTAGTDKKGVALFKFRMKQLFIERKSLRYNFDILRCKLSVMLNPKRPKTIAPIAFIEDFEKIARSLGVVDIGYTKIVPGLLFKNKSVPFQNMIVFTLEMEKGKIDQAPSLDTFNMIHNTYARLNSITIKLSTFLRKNGYGARGTPATLGVCHYPPIAEMAGIGCRGWHGLLITPKLGVCQRIAAIFTSIENLPFPETNEHLWINDFCKSCRVCAKKCPPEAIFPDYQYDDLGHQKHVESLKCVPYFVENYGCSLCIKNCTFTKSDYAKIKEVWINRNANSQLSKVE